MNRWREACLVSLREVIQLAAMDLAKERMIDQSLMAQESNRRKYQIDPEEVNKG
jgi:hypothetical protein